MTENDEILIYDALAAMMENSSILAPLINLHGNKVEREAYKNGIYSPCIKLQLVLGTEAMNRGKARHEKIKKDCEEFFKNKENKL